MVQQATSVAEAQAASPEDSGDQPLIADENTPRPFWEIDAEVAAQEAAKGAAQQGAGQESTGDAEQPGAGAAEPEGGETPEPEGEKPEAEAEGEAEAGQRTYTADEWGKREAALNRQMSERDQKLSALEQTVQQLQQQGTQQALAAQVSVYSDQVATALAESMPEKDAQGVANWAAGIQKNAFLISEENKALKAQLSELTTVNESTARSTVARDLAAKYGVPDGDRFLLLNQPNNEEMEKAAKRLGQLNKNRQIAAKQKQDEVPDTGPEQQFDGGSGASGPTDDQKLADLNTDPSELLRILTARGQSPI